MDRNDREHVIERSVDEPISEELLALLRHRVMTRFYDRPHVIDAVARAMVRGRC
jgi:hypothetical protein